MTKTVREEFERVAESCRDALRGLAELEDESSKDLQDIDLLIRRFEGNQGNVPATAEEARSLAVLIRKTIDGNKLSVQLTRVMMLLMLQVTILSQMDGHTPMETPSDPSASLAEWLQEWREAESAWEEFVSQA